MLGRIWWNNRSVLPVFELPINGILYYTLFRVWLLFFNILFVKVIHIFIYSYNSIILVVILSSTVCTRHSLFFLSSLDGHLGSLQFFTVTANEALNTSFGDPTHPFLSGIFVGVEPLICVYPTLVDATSSLKWSHQFTLPSAVRERSGLYHFAVASALPTLLPWVSFSCHHCDHLNVCFDKISLENGCNLELSFLLSLK